MTTIRPVRIDADNFAPYGRVARRPTSEPLAADAAFSYWSDVARCHVDGETEIGYCTVYRREEPRVTWMERHVRTPEILIPIGTSFILPVMEEGGRVEAFHVAPGEAVVIGPGVWHSACHPAEAPEATYFVLFRRGTPQEDVTKTDVHGVALDAAALRAST